MNQQTLCLIRIPLLILQHGYNKVHEGLSKLQARIEEVGGELTSRAFVNMGQFPAESYADFFKVNLNQREGLKSVNFAVITVASVDEDKIKAFMTEIQPALERVSGSDLMTATTGAVPN